MISKIGQDICNSIGVSEKTYRNIRKMGRALDVFKENIGEELYDKFVEAHSYIHSKGKGLSYEDMTKVETLPPEKQIELAKKIIETPLEIRKIWEEYFPKKLKLTIQLDKDVSKLLEIEAKKINVSKSQYASSMITLILRMKQEEN